MSSIIAADVRLTREDAPRLPAALVSVALGIVILFGVGFAPLDIVHNAAHDVRHVFAMPCH